MPIVENPSSASSAAGPEVLVLQHTLEDTPGFLGRWLDREGVTWQVRCAEAGEAYPDSVAPFRALAVLGGEWSANDPRPSLRQAEALIREADARGIPVLGHCLGGQLMARALGGRVQRMPQPEVGWWPMVWGDDPAAREWLGDAKEAVVYQWHYDHVVEPPPGARVIAKSEVCAQQAFVWGPHLAMQFHIEITPEKIEAWLAHPGAVYPEAIGRHPDSVESPAAMRASTLRHQAASEALADRIYRCWRARWRAQPTASDGHAQA